MPETPRPQRAALSGGRERRDDMDGNVEGGEVGSP